MRMGNTLQNKECQRTRTSNCRCQAARMIPPAPSRFHFPLVATTGASETSGQCITRRARPEAPLDGSPVNGPDQKRADYGANQTAPIEPQPILLQEIVIIPNWGRPERQRSARSAGTRAYSPLSSAHQPQHISPQDLADVVRRIAA